MRYLGNGRGGSWRVVARFGGLLVAVAFAAWFVAGSAGPVMADHAGEVGSAPPTSITDLMPFTTINTNGDYVAAGIGLRGTTSGNITISGIPATATVNTAYLYWGMLDNGESASLKNLTFSGTPITGTLIGSGPDTCWLRSGSFAYRANVTAFVPGTGNGTHSLTGVASGGSILAQGASLVVVYNNAADPFRTVVLIDGNDVLRSVGDSVTNALSGFTAAAPVTAKTTYMVGDGQTGAPENVSFTGGAGAATFNNSMDGSDGGLWDTETHVVSAQVAAGDTSATVNINIGGDCLMWVAQAFSVTKAPPEGQININKVDGVTGAALADSCFQVNDAVQLPLFQVCDNDFQGPPNLNPVCVPDGVCEDEDPAAGTMQVTVDAGTFSVQESKAPPNYNPKAMKLPCTVLGGGKCDLTVLNQPLFEGLKVGGLAVDLDGDLGDLPLETAQSSGPNAGVLAGTIAGITALAVMLSGAAWCARRKVN